MKQTFNTNVGLRAIYILIPNWMEITHHLLTSQRISLELTKRNELLRHSWALDWQIKAKVLIPCVVKHSTLYHTETCSNEIAFYCSTYVRVVCQTM